MNRTCSLQPPGLPPPPRVSRRMWLLNDLWAFPGCQSRVWFLESSFKANIQELHWEVGPLGKAPLEFTSEVPTLPTCTHFPHKLGNRKSVHFILHGREAGKQDVYWKDFLRLRST